MTVFLTYLGSVFATCFLQSGTPSLFQGWLISISAIQITDLNHDLNKKIKSFKSYLFLHFFGLYYAVVHHIYIQGNEALIN